MYKLGQIMALVATITMLVLCVLLITISIDNTTTGSFFIVALIVQLSGVAISKKFKK